VNIAPPRLILTAGEPAGIGPDLCVLLAQQAHSADLVVATAPELLQQRASLLGLPLTLDSFDPAAAPLPQVAGRLRVLPIALAEPVHPGRLNAANAGHVLAALEHAARSCLEGVFAALVTGPVHKGVINDAGIPFFGHTSYLARLCGLPIPVMMLVAPGLRVALVTTHLPLRRWRMPLPRSGWRRSFAFWSGSCGPASPFPNPAFWSAASIPMPARVAIWAMKKRKLSNPR